MSDIMQLNDRVKKEFGIDVKYFFNHLRLQYLKGELSKNPNLRPYLKRVLGKEPEETIRAPNLDDIVFGEDWSSIEFHLKHRVTSIDGLARVLNISADKNTKNIVDQGYLLSIMPLNIAIGNRDMLDKYFPKVDFFFESAVKKTDPYGIFSKGAIIEKDGVYIGSQKFPKSLLMNITNICPFGCVPCYKAVYTRVKGSKFFTDLEKASSVQAEKLVEYLNENPNVRSVIMSGGEPLFLPNEGVKNLLSKLRIDDELLDILKKFENEIGIQVHFNAHLAHPSQFTTDALIAVKKIRDKGFYINAQVPLQRNVNIFLEDKEKTLRTLYELTELQGTSGVRPYKYVLHMNCGSLEYSVPLEFMLDILGELKYRPNHPWPETWQPVSMSILCDEGNILLSPQLLFSLTKSINNREGYVEYKIPIPEDGFRPATYREPIIIGYNDNPNSLYDIRKIYNLSLKENLFIFNT